MAGITFPGIGSGINGAAIAKALSDQLTLSNVIRENEIKSLTSENSSLEKLRTLLLEVNAKLDGLRTTNGGAGAKSAGTSNSDVVTAAADATAGSGAFAVSVSSLASNATGSFDRSFGSKTDFIISDPGKAGTLTFDVGQGASTSSFSVAVDEFTTVESFVATFNANANGAAAASAINVGTAGSPDYRIAFQTTNVGEEEGRLVISSSNGALFDADALSSQTLEQATNARFTVSGISGTIERSSNSISDVVSGLSFELKGTGSAVITVGNEAGAAASQLGNAIGAFNALAEFIRTEDLVTVSGADGDTRNVYASLAATNVDDDALSTLRSAFSAAQAGNGLTLASFGVSTDRDGALSFDEEAFTEAFQADPETALELLTNLADRISGVQGVVNRFTGFQLTIDQAIDSNNSAIEGLNAAIARVQAGADAREEVILKQFSNLEGVMARLQANASVISSLLQF